MGLFGTSKEHVKSRRIPFPVLENVPNVKITNVKMERASFGKLQMIFELTCDYEGKRRTQYDYRELPEEDKVEPREGETERDALERVANQINDSMREYALACGINNELMKQTVDVDDAEQFGKIIEKLYQGRLNSLPLIKVKTYLASNGYPKVGRTTPFAVNNDSDVVLSWSDWEIEQNEANKDKIPGRVVDGIEAEDEDQVTSLDDESFEEKDSVVQFLDD